MTDITRKNEWSRSLVCVRVLGMLCLLGLNLVKRTHKFHYEEFYQRTKVSVKYKLLLYFMLPYQCSKCNRNFCSKRHVHVCARARLYVVITKGHIISVVLLKLKKCEPRSIKGCLYTFREHHSFILCTVTRPFASGWNCKSNISVFSLP